MIKYYQYLIGAIIGALIVFLLVGRVADVKLERSTFYSNTHTHETTTVVITNSAQITGGTNATISPNGNIAISGANISISTNSTTTSIGVSDTNTATVSTHSEKTITYNGSVFILYNPFELKVYPSIIGITYTLVNPFCFMVQYDIDDRKLFVGGELKF